MTLLANQHFTMNIEQNDQNLDISLTPTGTLRRQDLGLIAPAINRALESQPFHQIKALIDIRLLEGVPLRGLLNELKLVAKHRNIPTDIMIIGRKRRHKFIARVLRLATKGKVKYFDCFDTALSSRVKAEDTDWPSAHML